jgi:hypothetical protein
VAAQAAPVSPRRIEINVAEAIRLYVEERLTLAEVAAKLRCSVGTARTRLKEAGVEIRPPGGYAASRPRAEHGSTTMYRNRCTCEPCRQAGRRERREAEQRRGEMYLQYLDRLADRDARRTGMTDEEHGSDGV